MASVKIKQHDITDCGAACLASVAAYWHLHIPIARIRQYAGTDKKGTNILGLTEASKKLGLNVIGVRGEMESLSKIPLPAIAHLELKEKQLHHYVVIYEVTSKYIKIMDPADGQFHKKSIDEFEKDWSGVLVLLEQKDSFEMRNDKISVFKRFWFLLSPHKGVLIQAFVGAVAYTFLGFSTSIYIQKLTDFVLVGGNTNLLNLLSVLLLIAFVIQLIIGSFKDIFLVKTGQQIDARLILGYYKHLLKLPQSFFDTMRVGEIISRIGDAVKIRHFINNVSLNLTVDILIFIFSFVFMFTFYWKLALIMLIMIPLFALNYTIVNRLNKKTERKVMERAADLESQLVESLNSIATIKHFGLESFANIKTETSFIVLLKTGYKSALNAVYTSVSSSGLSQLFTIIQLWVGSYFVIRGEMTVGSLLSFYTIIGYFMGPVSRLIGANVQIQSAWIAADRLFEIMDLEREREQHNIELTKENVGDIVFKNVSFRYGTRVDVFKKFNLRIKKDELTAIVGESGSGKSTLISLIQNIYPVQKGKINIGDLPLNHINLTSLRSLVSVVPQKIDLFSGNVIENIAVGEFEPDQERIFSICKSIGILDFIESLPDQFYTYLGENGSLLSGGQKQRIAIARALYQNPEILILDEATSSLDSTSENYIQNTIRTLKKEGKTIILIAHRLSSVYHADSIIVLKNGKVKEQGNHQDLISQKGAYYELLRSQNMI